MNESQRGFGAVELLIVLLVLGVIGGALFLIANNKKPSTQTTSNSAQSSQAKTLLAEVKSSKTTAYNWDLKIYEDGSGSTDFTNAPGNTRPLPSNNTFQAGTFSTTSLQTALDSLNPSSYVSSCDQPENYSVIYKNHTYQDIQCYIGVASNHATSLGSQLSKTFDKAGL